MTLAASKHSGLSCRWALVLQRSTKKRPVFFFSPQRRLCGRRAGRLPASLCLPPPFAAWLLCQQKTQPSLSSSFRFSLPIHHTCLLCSLYFRISSPHILHQTHHFYVSAHVSEDLSSSAGIHLSASTTSRSSLIPVAPQHPIVRGSCQVCCCHGNHAEE